MPQKITLTLRPGAAFEMTYSEGYQLYSTLLRIMQEADSAMAKHTHDSSISCISLGPLEGLAVVQRVEVRFGNEVKTWYLNMTDSVSARLKDIGMSALFKEETRLAG
jgi:hypothetical protein